MSNASGRTEFPHVFTPIKVGTIELDHRLVVPPHGGGAGNLMGDEATFEQHCAQWLAKLDGGVQWLGGSATFVRNPLIPGFESTGVGAHGSGFFRMPGFVERLGDLASRVHSRGGFLSTQMVLQGGMPIGASPAVTGYNDHRIPHVLHIDEVRWLVREYGESAALAAEAGVDAIEIHANHDDIVQWFLSPVSNHRTDDYGGSAENRMRFLREIVSAIRREARRPVTLGLRLCLDERIDGGYVLDDLCDMVARFTADGEVDYFSFDIGSNWGTPSYIPHASTAEAQWAPMSGTAKQATDLPVVYCGRITDPASAEALIAAGHADIAGLVRATIADPQFVRKTIEGRAAQIRPCIGLNECIHAKQVDGHSYACGVNPQWARESKGAMPDASTNKRVLVVGGGPGGMETAALAAESGHQVTLWERAAVLGGALAVAALAPVNRRYANWIRWQEARLARAGVTVEFERDATATDVVAFGADAVVTATGAIPRRPLTPGANLPHVLLGAEALREPDRLGRRVLVVAEDDGPAPLSITDFIAGIGHEVTLAFQTTAPSPLVGKYSIGAMLERLDHADVTLLATTRVVEITTSEVTGAHSYSNRRRPLGAFDSVVLVCGAVGNDTLFHELRTAGAPVHLLGDAFTAGRLIHATREAWELVAELNRC